MQLQIKCNIYTVYDSNENHFLNATVLWILISFVETHWWYCDI